MLMEGFFLKFQGFQPSDFTRSYLNNKMSVIQNEAPYGANVYASFTRNDHLFKGVVTIYSSAGKFFAAASGSQIRAVSNKLVNQIRKQLDRWKSQRFHHEGRNKHCLRESHFNREDKYDTHGMA